MVGRGVLTQGRIKLLDFSLSSIGWRRGLGRGGAFSLVSPLLGPLPARSSRGEDGELDAALVPFIHESMSGAAARGPPGLDSSPATDKAFRPSGLPNCNCASAS